MKTKTRNGAQTLVATLQQLGVRHVFGYPGGAALPMFDALHGSQLQLVLTRHEQGAVHMADGYARATGKPGVVFVTSGPGATNAVTGLYTAHMDSSPVVVVCGQVATTVMGQDAFQEADVFHVTMPVCKHNYLVTHAPDIEQTVHEAFRVATEGRPGPVVIDLPRDVAAAEVANTDAYRTASPCGRHTDVDTDTLAKFAKLLCEAKRPLLLIGQGALLSRAANEVVSLAETLRAPVVTTLLGKGAFPESHPLSLGMLGMHGTAYANMAAVECDLICSVGSRWDDRIVGRYDTFCRNAVKLHIDVDPVEIGKVVRPDCHLTMDAKQALCALLPLVRPLDTKRWLARLDQLKKRFPLCVPNGKQLTAQYVLHLLDELTQGRAVLTTDVGQHQMWAAQFCKTQRPYSWITSGGAGTMGFGFPAAIGAQLGRPDETVVAIVGDGGFQMTLAELATAVRLKLPLKILLLDNAYLGMVRQWQELFYDNRLEGVAMDDNPDFVALAKAYGAHAIAIATRGEARTKLRKALAHASGPCLIHAKVERQENVFPMVPAGKRLEDMVLQPK